MVTNYIANGKLVLFLRTMDEISKFQKYSVRPKGFLKIKHICYFKVILSISKFRA